MLGYANHDDYSHQNVAATAATATGSSDNAATSSSLRSQENHRRPALMDPQRTSPATKWRLLDTFDIKAKCIMTRIGSRSRDGIDNIRNTGLIAFEGSQPYR